MLRNINLTMLNVKKYRLEQIIPSITKMVVLHKVHITMLVRLDKNSNNIITTDNKKKSFFYLIICTIFQKNKLIEIASNITHEFIFFNHDNLKKVLFRYIHMIGIIHHRFIYFLIYQSALWITIIKFFISVKKAGLTVRYN